MVQRTKISSLNRDKNRRGSEADNKKYLLARNRRLKRIPLTRRAKATVPTPLPATTTIGTPSGTPIFKVNDANVEGKEVKAEGSEAEATNNQLG